MPMYKFVKVWFLPPGVFIVISLAISLYLFFYIIKSRREFIERYYNLWLSVKYVTILCLGLAAFIYFLSINAVSQRAMRSLEYSYAKTENKADAIFVLGGAEVRYKTASVLQKQTGVDVVVSGYNGEAERTRKVLLQNGVPDSKIIIEPKARNTKENAKYMLPLAVNNGYKRIYLITSAYHMPRSMMNFDKLYKKNGIEVLPYPCGYTVSRTHSYEKPQWLPEMINLWYSTKAWDEYLGMLELIILQ